MSSLESFDAFHGLFSYHIEILLNTFTGYRRWCATFFVMSASEAAIISKAVLGSDHPIKTLMDIAYTYGDVAHFKLGRRRHVYLLNNPDYIEDVLIRNHKNFIKSRGLQES